MRNIKSNFVYIILSIFLFSFTLGCTTNNPPINGKTSVLTQDDRQWILTIVGDGNSLYRDWKSAVTAGKNSDLQSYSTSADNMSVDSQKAIDNSNKYDVSDLLKPEKDEYNLAMEQAGQATIYMKKTVEDCKKGSDDEKKADSDEANKYLKSCDQHLDNVSSALRPLLNQITAEEPSDTNIQEISREVQKAHDIRMNITRNFG
jgi:hypothetical protein